MINQIILSGQIRNLTEYTTKDGRKKYFIFDLLAADGGRSVQIKCYIEASKDVEARIKIAQDTDATVTIFGSLSMKSKENVYIYSVNGKTIML